MVELVGRDEFVVGVKCVDVVSEGECGDVSL